MSVDLFRLTLTGPEKTIWDLKEFKPLRSYKMKEEGFATNFSPDGDQILVARADLNTAMASPEELLHKWAVKNQVKGTYHIDLTLHERGKVTTVFCSGSENGQIKFQNELKDILMSFEFSFKTPKGRDYKFSYSFTF